MNDMGVGGGRPIGRENGGMDRVESDDAAIERYRAPALEKGLDIIELLARVEDGLTQAAIAKSLGRSPNENYRMLDTLVRRGYVARVGDTYELTLKIFALAHQHPPMRRLVTDATPGMREISLWARQSCHLAVYDRGEVLVVAQYDSPSYYGLAIRAGSRIGLADTGSGHVLLAFAHPHEQESMLAERAPRPGEPASDDLMRRLRTVRARGHERMRSRQIKGVVNLSVPVLGPNGAAVAALSVPFLHRIDQPDAPGMEAVLERLAAVAARLSRATGAAATPGIARGGDR